MARTPILLALAVVLPCSAWYVVGTRALDREARDLVAAPAADAAHTAARLAERTRERLRSVVRMETDRPWYQYRHAYPDLTENCECAGWIESPLARGPADPFVLAHFEVDPSLRLSLPTVVPEGEEGPPPSREPGSGGNSAGPAPSHQRSTRSARSVTHRDGSPGPSSTSNHTFPGGRWSRAHVPSSRRRLRTCSTASPTRGSAGRPATSEADRK